MSGESKKVVEVLLALPHQARRVTLSVPLEATAREVALLAEQAGLRFDGSGVTAARAALGVYAERVEDDFVLQANDRLEIYRPLPQDPMQLRRARAKRGKN